MLICFSRTFDADKNGSIDFKEVVKIKKNLAGSLFDLKIAKLGHKFLLFWRLLPGIPISYWCNKQWLSWRETELGIQVFVYYLN